MARQRHPPTQSSNSQARDIRLFFKPKSSVDEATITVAPDPPPSTPSPGLPPLAILPDAASPCPSPAARTQLDRDAVIQDSDDEFDGGLDGYGSDSSFEDLATILQTQKAKRADLSPRLAPANDTASSRNLCVTPKAKRIATSKDLYSSPLTLLPKPEFDMKALLNDAREADAVREGLRRATNHVKEDATSTSQATDASSKGADSWGLLPALQSIDTVSDVDSRKLMSAIRRTETGVASRRWHFFRPDACPPSTATTPDRQPFPPSLAANNKWAFLADPATRTQHLLSGLPRILLKKGIPCPDELFLWILDGVVVEGDAQLRDELRVLAALCSSLTSSLVTPALLNGWLRALGASDDIDVTAAPLELALEYGDREIAGDWGRVESLLRWLASAAACLPVDTLTHVAIQLLRMSTDTIIGGKAELADAHCKALEKVCSSVPDASWDQFCGDVCNSLYTSFPNPSLRVTPLLVIQSSEPQLHDLRRRLATAYCFDDPALARNKPEQVVTLSDATAFVHKHDVRRMQDQDYVELRALILLLNMAVDDGSFGVFADTTGDGATDATAAKTTEDAFNTAVDELAQALRTMWAGIQDPGPAYVLQTEAKRVIELFQYRLMVTVRTRRQPKKDIYDLAKPKRDEASVPQQQQFMAKFLARRNAPADPAT